MQSSVYVAPLGRLRWIPLALIPAPNTICDCFAATSTNARSSQPSSPITEARTTALTRTLTGTLAFLGTSIVALEANPAPNDGGNGGGITRGATKDAAGGGTDAATDAKNPATTAKADESPGGDDEDEAVRALKRAHGILKAEEAAIAAAAPGQQSSSAVSNLTGAESGGVGEVRKQTAKVLDTLSEAYAGKGRWELARCVL